VTLAYGQNTVDPGAIEPCANAPVLPYRLPQLRPGFASLLTFTTSGVFIVPNGVTRAKVTVIGGGGAGGTHATLPGGGGGGWRSGDWSRDWTHTGRHNLRDRWRRWCRIDDTGSRGAGWNVQLRDLPVRDRRRGRRRRIGQRADCRWGRRQWCGWRSE